MPPHPNATPKPDDWLDQALQQAFSAELSVGLPVVAEIEDIEDVLAATPLVEGGASASKGPTGSVATAWFMAVAYGETCRAPLT